MQNIKKCNCSVRLKNIFVKDNNQILLNNISLQVNHGEILALIGRNGSGKTTLLKAILNRIPYTGNISFFNSLGEKIKTPKIGYVPQKLNFEKNTPLTVLEFFASNMSKIPIWFKISTNIFNKIYNILKKFNIEYLINNPIANISGGELQRVLLAFALEPVPDILILDEPSSALDKKGVELFYSVITKMRQEYHMPVILVSHDLIQIQKNVTKYALIESGKIIENSIIENLKNSEKIKDIFGV